MCVALLYYSYFHFYCAAYHYLLIYHIDTPDYNTKCGSKQANVPKSHSSPRLPHHLNSKKNSKKNAANIFIAILDTIAGTSRLYYLCVRKTMRLALSRGSLVIRRAPLDLRTTAPAYCLSLDWCVSRGGLTHITRRLYTCVSGSPP